MIPPTLDSFRVAALAIAVLAPSSLPALAQQLGDARRGLAYAERTCADCHAVRASDRISPDPKAAPFWSIAQRPGMNERALSVFLATPHKDMPNLIIAPNDRDDVIAYIVSLRTAGR